MDELGSIESIATEEISEAPTTPEPPPPPPEAPPPKKKKLSEDRLTKLAKARARASEVAQEKRERKPRPSDDPIVVVEQEIDPKRGELAKTKAAQAPTALGPL